MLEDGFGRRYRPENRLRQAVVAGLEGCGLDEICWSPEWRPAMERWPAVGRARLGGFDLALRHEGAASYSAVCELKWSKWGDKEALDELPWDCFKLAHAVDSLPGVSEAFLVYAARLSAWKKPARFAEWFDGALVNPRNLLANHRSVWKWLLERGAKARPLALPEAIETSGVARQRFSNDGTPWEIRVASVRPAVGPWFELAEGWQAPRTSEEIQV
jgi:hypothetical protein